MIKRFDRNLIFKVQDGGQTPYWKISLFGSGFPDWKGDFKALSEDDIYLLVCLSVCLSVCRQSYIFEACTKTTKAINVKF